MKFAIVREVDGVVDRLVEAQDLETLLMNTPAGCDPHPCDNPAVVPGEWRWGSGGFAPRTLPEPTPDELRADLIAKVKQTAEEWRMRFMSPGGAKKAVYSMKQAEVEAFNALGTTLAGRLAAVLGLSATARGRRFRYALAEAAIRNEPDISKAIDRFAAGADISNAGAARIEAVEQLAVMNLRAAKTLGELRAVYAALSWQ
ncbi:hypothetical protein [Sphingomonas hankookensis]